MISLRFLIFLLFATMIRYSRTLPITYNNYNNYSTYDQKDVSFWDHVNLEKLLLSCKPLCDPRGATTDVQFYLYTRKNPSVEQRHEIKIGDSESIRKSYFNYKNPTRFIIHGWNNGYISEVNTIITDAYIHKADYNIIVVNWSSCAKRINYFAARCCVDNVGEQIAQLIDFLNSKHKLSFKQVKLIGHSLGAHIAGFAGKNVKNGRIPTIIGLDPAMPCFKSEALHERLSATDAEYVETIHTNAGILGFLDPIGVASFYPNGGTKQPGCLKLSCSHSRSYKYYAESVEGLNQFIPKKCNNMKELINDECIIKVNDIKMGGDPSSTGKAEGIFILPTNAWYPYALGEH